MRCPVCTSATLVMSERQGIEIDYCPDCRGVWLDRGELDKIIERAVPQAQALTQPRNAPQAGVSAHGHTPGHGHRGRPHNVKSFLHELFD